MIDKLALWIIKKLIMFHDRDGSFLAFSFSKDERTEFHIIKEQFLKDKWIYGTSERQYPKHEKMEVEHEAKNDG